MKLALFSVCGLLASLVALVCPNHFQPDRSTGRKLATSFQMRPLVFGKMPTCNRVILQFKIEKGVMVEGFLGLDPNSCEFNEFGDVTSCTERGYWKSSVTFREVTPSKPDAMKRKLFRIENATLEAEMYLITSAELQGPYRLLGKKDGKIDAIITLEDWMGL